MRAPNGRVTDLYGDLRPEDVRTGGLPALRDAIAHFHRLAPEHITVTCSGSLSLVSAIRAIDLSARSNLALIPRPHYPAYPGLARLLGFDVRFYDYRLNMCGEWELAVDQLLDHIRRHRPGLVILNNPHNPTGTYLERAVVDLIATEVEKSPGIVLIDEVFADLLLDAGPSLQTVGAAPAHILRVGAFNKRFPMLADERCGYVLGAPEWVAKVQAIHQAFGIGPSVRTQRAVLRVMTTEPRAMLQRVCRELREHRDWACAVLQASPVLTVVPPRAGLFLWVGLPPGTDALQFSSACQQKTGVRHAAGPNFGVTHSPWVRLRFGIPLRQLKARCAEFLACVEAQCTRGQLGMPSS